MTDTISVDCGRGLDPAPSTTAQSGRRGRWIDHWEPDDESFWASTGEKIARKNLALSMFAEHLGFSVWVLWTIVVLNLANHGITLSVSELFLLTLIPNLIGSVLRIPYTFAVPRFGGRVWTTVSAALLFIPTLLLAIVVPSGWLAHQGHTLQLWVLLACAATAGVGGGNFSSSMANLSFIGFSFALPLVIKNTFPEFLAGHPFIATYLAGLGFMGALIGSLSRPLGGWLSDKIGGARVTLAVFGGMAVFTASAISGVQQRSFGVFFPSYMATFLLAGIGTRSTYKLIPST